MRLDELRELATAEGPFATVYLDVSHDTPDAAHAIRTGWRDRRAELAEAGADDATLAALDREVTALAEGERRAVGTAGRVLVAADGELRLSRELPAPPARPHAAWSEVADLLDLVTELPEPVPTVIVLVDSTGAEIHTDEGVRHVEGAEKPVHQVRGGGPHHWRMTRRAEETRKQNLDEVAAAVDAEVASHGAQLLVVVGEVQSRARLCAALGGRASEIAVEVDGSRGGDHEELDERVRGLQRALVADRRRAALDRLEQAGGNPTGLGVEGLSMVLAALRSAQVETLFVDAATGQSAPVWVGADPAQLSEREQELRDLGVRPRGPVPAGAALIRAAAGTGAELLPIGGDRTGLAGRPLADGLGAVLRGPIAL